DHHRRLLSLDHPAHVPGQAEREIQGPARRQLARAAHALSPGRVDHRLRLLSPRHHRSDRKLAQPVVEAAAMSNVQSLKWFWPESVLTLAVMALLIQDLLTRKDKHRVRDLTIGAFVWLLLVVVATALTPGGTQPLFGGLIQHDPM